MEQIPYRIEKINRGRLEIRNDLSNNNLSDRDQYFYYPISRQQPVDWEDENNLSDNSDI